MSTITIVGKIVIIGALLKFSSGAVNDLYYGISNGVAVNVARTQMKQLHDHLMEYFSRAGQYPRSSLELNTFIKNEFDTPLEQILLDPWKNPYLFFSDRAEILSWGPDKKLNTGDDLIVPYPENIRHSIQRP